MLHSDHLSSTLLNLSPIPSLPSPPNSPFPRFLALGFVCDPFSLTSSIYVTTGLEPLVEPSGVASWYITEANQFPL